MFLWLSSGHHLVALLQLSNLFLSSEPGHRSPLPARRLVPSSPADMAAFAARHSSLLVAALVPHADRTRDDSSLALIAESIGAGGASTLVASRFDTVFAFTWPYVAIKNQEVQYACPSLGRSDLDTCRMTV